MDRKSAVGERLHQLRVERGITSAEELSKLMGGVYRPEAIRRRERGFLKIDTEYVQTFCNATKLTGLERLQLIELAKVFALQFDRWSNKAKSNADLHYEFWDRLCCVTDYVSFDPLIVPWGLQTERYAYEMIKMHGADHAQALNGAKARANLAASLWSQSPLVTSGRVGATPSCEAVFIFCEDALYRHVGTPSTMLQQIDYLLDARLPKHIRIGIIPRTRAHNVAAFYSFNLFGNVLATFETAAGAVHVADETTLSWINHCATTLTGEAIPLSKATIILSDARTFHEAKVS